MPLYPAWKSVSFNVANVRESRGAFYLRTLSTDWPDSPAAAKRGNFLCGSSRAEIRIRNDPGGVSIPLFTNARKLVFPPPRWKGNIFSNDFNQRRINTRHRVERVGPDPFSQQSYPLFMLIESEIGIKGTENASRKKRKTAQNWLTFQHSADAGNL